MRNLIYNFCEKKQKSALYNQLILLHLYKTNKQNLKHYNPLLKYFTIRLNSNGYTDYTLRSATSIVKSPKKLDKQRIWNSSA